MQTQLARALFAGTLFSVGVPLLAQPTTDQAVVSAAGPVKPEATLEPEAAQALDRMGAYLRNLNRFEVISDATIDMVFEDNQKLQFGQRTTYLVQAPSWMRVDIETDRQNRRIYYDGKTITLAGQAAKKYLSFPQTGTISQVLTEASERFGIEFPLQDLFRWGDPSSQLVAPKSGFKIGASRVNGVPAEHFAFRGEHADFQLWIGKENPLPLKMVVTGTDNPAQPQFTTILRWNQTPTFGARDFTFTPDAGWQAVDLKAIQGSGSPTRSTELN